MRHISVAKAQPALRSDPIEDVQITIGGAEILSGAMTIEQARDVFDHQARVIAHALATSLPGGTLDRLTALLLERKASSLRVLG